MSPKSSAAAAVPATAPNDLAAYWMPFTANRAFKRTPRMVVGAKDMHYFCLLYTSRCV